VRAAASGRESLASEVNTDMYPMFVTFDVSAQLSGLAPVFPVSPLLKAFPPTLPGVTANMPYMSVTAPVLHALTSWLKAVAS
jgi:hypothetical protein